MCEYMKIKPRNISIHVCLFAYLDSVQTGATALYAAAQEGHLRVVEMLLEANADVNIKTNVRPNMVGTSYPLVRMHCKGYCNIVQSVC